MLDHKPEKVECESINHVASTPSTTFSNISMTDTVYIQTLQQEIMDIKSMIQELSVNFNSTHLRFNSNTSSTNAIKSDHYEPIPIMPLEIDSTFTELSHSETNHNKHDLYPPGSPDSHSDPKQSSQYAKYNTEEADYFQSPPTIRERIRFYLIDSMGRLGFGIDLFILFLIVWSLAMFILSTEDIEVFGIEVFLTSCFALEYLLRCYASRNVFGYMFSFHGLIDAISFLPSFIAITTGSNFNLSFLRAFRALRAFRLFRYTLGSTAKQDVGDSIPVFNGLFHINSLSLQIYRSAFTTSVLILVIAGLMFFAEGPDSDLDVPTVANFFESLYFTIVAISTVGFGEISPGGVGGQLIMIFAIPICIVMLPLQGALIGDAYEKYQKQIDDRELERRSSWTLEDVIHESRVNKRRWRQRFSCIRVPKESTDFES